MSGTPVQEITMDDARIIARGRRVLELEQAAVAAAAAPSMLASRTRCGCSPRAAVA